ncbi:MAG: hypothetical protein JWO15_419 [Sphingomonadales bacterium]|nr:hypothetical protein [Sphingomonadales bacterium]
MLLIRDDFGVHYRFVQGLHTTTQIRIETDILKGVVAGLVSNVSTNALIYRNFINAIFNSPTLTPTPL